jgi:putative tryptophan/tyrosine transport system substrate-binding protein
LVALSPDVILTNGAAGVAALLEASRRVPVVFVLVADPVGGGFVDSLAHPDGNATGLRQLNIALAASGWNSSSRLPLR